MSDSPTPQTGLLGTSIPQPYAPGPSAADLRQAETAAAPALLQQAVANGKPEDVKRLVTQAMLAQVLGLTPAPGENAPMFFTRVAEYAKQFVHPTGETLYTRATGSKA